ncbi:MAG: DUF5110 domain-containing protein [Bacteroidales bacterium]|nr:DUF5110 domain-containing protein [Bacteroidales bacterium]
MKYSHIIVIAVAVALSSCTGSGCGEAYLVRDGVAVFEPQGYDATQHSPSPIFISEPVSVNGAPSPDNWELKPQFGHTLFGKSTVEFSCGDADLYGTGEVSGNLRRNDDRQNFWNTENPMGMLKKGKQLYESHPWILGVRKDGSAFGIIADNTWKSSLDTRGKIRFTSEGPAFRVAVIEKENPEEVLKTLSDLTGRMELPPLWALGFQQCRYSYYPQEMAAGIADTLRSHRIPCDVIWMDIHYMDKFKVFTFDPEGYRDPKGLNDYLHSLDFKAVYMIDPGVKAEEGYFVDDQGMEADYFMHDRKGGVFHGKVWPGECHFPDFTRPEVCRWWAGLYKDFMSNGIDGVWNDMNEPSVFVGFGGTLPENSVHRGGGNLPAGPHIRYHNIYGYLMVKASREGIMAANPEKRPFVLSRSNFLGGHRYAAMWTGDNYSDYAPMKESVPMCLNISLSGQPFNGPDIGGFLRDCTPELLRHWTASGVFFPFARNHAALGTARQEPWAFDSRTEDICRRAIERRYRLLPYYYTLFEEASRTGLPVMRPIFWSDWKDNSLRGEQQAYLVGNDLMIIPRWSENPSLPDADWDLFTFEGEGPDDGYQSYMALRPGAALPVTGIIQSTAQFSTDSLTVLVNPDAHGKAAGCLYEDEGEGYAYRNGDFSRYSICVETLSDGLLNLTLVQTDGYRIHPNRVIRIGQVCNGQVIYSRWFSNDSASMPLIDDDCRTMELEKMKFVPVVNGSISVKMTKTELIMTNIVN